MKKPSTPALPKPISPLAAKFRIALGNLLFILFDISLVVLGTALCIGGFAGLCLIFCAAFIPHQPYAHPEDWQLAAVLIFVLDVMIIICVIANESENENISAYQQTNRSRFLCDGWMQAEDCERMAQLCDEYLELSQYRDMVCAMGRRFMISEFEMAEAWPKKLSNYEKQVGSWQDWKDKTDKINEKHRAACLRLYKMAA
jgi:hypothetical protein